MHPPDAKQATSFPFVSGLWNGFFNRRFYAYVATCWESMGFAYLFFVVFLSIVPLVFAAHAALSKFYYDDIPYMLEQMPTITIEDGRAQSGTSGVTTIYAKSGEAVGVIATDDTYARPQDADVTFLVTSQSLMVVEGGQKARSYDFSEMEDAVLTRQKIEEFAAGLWPWMTPALAIVMLIGLYVWRLLQTLIYSLIGMVVARVLGMQIQFVGIMQVSMVAVATSVIASTLVSTAIGTGLPAVVTIPIALFYLCFGLKATRDWARSQQPPKDDAGEGI